MNNDQFISLMVLTVVCGLVVGFGVHIGFTIFFEECANVGPMLFCS